MAWTEDKRTSKSGHKGNTDKRRKDIEFERVQLESCYTFVSCMCLKGHVFFSAESQRVVAY